MPVFPIDYLRFLISRRCSHSGLYPTLIEPNLTLEMQRIAWCCGFAVFAIISGILAWKTRSAAEAAPQEATDDPGEPGARTRDNLLWLLLPMGAAMQLSAVTSFITANVAAIPLLWILPLAVYLITLIIAFQFPRLAAAQHRFAVSDRDARGTWIYACRRKALRIRWS